jgi:hypothetical protein
VGEFTVAIPYWILLKIGSPKEGARKARRVRSQKDVDESHSNKRAEVVAKLKRARCAT